MSEIKVKVKGLINLSALGKPDNVFINKTIAGYCKNSSLLKSEYWIIDKF